MGIFDLPICAIVTGANRGFGRELCFVISSELPANSTLVLLGRNRDALESEKKELASKTPSINILIFHNFECNRLDTQSLLQFFNDHDNLFKDLSSLLLVHNAGSVGDPSQSCVDLGLPQVTDYMNINFNSMVATNSIVLNKFASCKHKTVINLSSLLALQPSKSLSLYCSCKLSHCTNYCIFH